MNDGVPRLLICLFLLCAASCQRHHSGTVVARVGDAELTIEEARTRVDTSHRTFERQLQNYVIHWVNSELIYQEAQRKGLDNSEQIVRSMEDVKRQLVNNTFLEKELYGDTTGIDERTLHEYFTKHAAEFFLHEDMMKLSLMTFGSREHASAFAATISRGSSWADAMNKSLRDTTVAADIVMSAEGQYYSQRTLFPPELWKVAASLTPGDASFPVKTSLGYSVVQLLAFVKQGRSAEFDLVKDEVRQRLLIEHRRKQYEELLGTLRKQHTVQVLLDLKTTSDTTQSSQHE